MGALRKRGVPRAELLACLLCASAPCPGFDSAYGHLASEALAQVLGTRTGLRRGPVGETGLVEAGGCPESGIGRPPAGEEGALELGMAWAEAQRWEDSNPGCPLQGSGWPVGVSPPLSPHRWSPLSCRKICSTGSPTMRPAASCSGPRVGSVTSARTSDHGGPPALPSSLDLGALARFPACQGAANAGWAARAGLSPS